LLKSRSESSVLDQNVGKGWDANIAAALLGSAEALASNPWIFRWPLLLAQVRPLRVGANWFLVDEQNHGLPCVARLRAVSNCGVWFPGGKSGRIRAERRPMVGRHP
jgi:hypothetical protein